MSAIRTVGVVGAGQMGAGIAQVAAAAGYTVVARDVDQAALDRARAGIAKSLAKFVEKGQLDAVARDTALGRLSFTTDLAGVAAADLVIEAIVEDLDAKTALWRELDRRAPAATIFASNTSSLSITTMAAATGRPDRVVGLHFFNPVPLMNLVEVIRGVATSPATFDAALGFARSLGKETVGARDTAGFVVNRLLVPYLLDAVRALEQGVGTVVEIDAAMKLGCGHPMGPLTLLDFVGLDTALRIGEILFGEFREPRMAPPPLLRRMVAAGLVGKKGGRGFYDWSVTPPVPTELGL
ncbi:MAG TPA: 3-hydroxybutyryl-CoA dehydrogenase [Gemmatimonadales bacterium]|nr:3-hydroxybutyryl-CoA dehydrogenase [Gemmatimonadales bacterium]